MIPLKTDTGAGSINVFKNGLNELGKAVDDCNKKLEKLNISVGDINDALSVFNRLASAGGFKQVAADVQALNASIDTLVQEFEGLNTVQKAANDNMVIYKDTLEKTGDTIGNIILGNLRDLAESIGLSGEAAVKAVGGIMYLVEKIIFLGAVAATFATLFPKTWSDKVLPVIGRLVVAIVGAGRTIGVVSLAAGRAIGAAFGPGSIAFLAIMALLALIDEVISQISNMILWQNRVDNKIQTISSTQPGQDNLKYVQYLDEVKILPMEEGPIKFDVEKNEPEPNNNRQGTNPVFNKATNTKDNKPGRINFGTSNSFSGIIKQEEDAVESLLKTQRNNVELAKLLGKEYENTLQTAINTLKTADNETLTTEKRISLLSAIQGYERDLKEIRQTEADRLEENIANLEKQLELNKGLVGAEKDLNAELEQQRNKLEYIKTGLDGIKAQEEATKREIEQQRILNELRISSEPDENLRKIKEVNAAYDEKIKKLEDEKLLTEEMRAMLNAQRKKEIDLIEYEAQQRKLQKFNDALQGTTEAISGLFSAFVPPQDALTQWEQFAKQIAIIGINLAQSLILEAAAAMFSKSILSFGISMFKDAPLLAAAYAALEVAKGFVGGFAKGTDSLHRSGYALVGEQGPELVYLQKGTKIFNNTDTNKMLNSARANQPSSVNVNNVYIASSLDAISFFRVNYPKYKKFKTLQAV